MVVTSESEFIENTNRTIDKRLTLAHSLTSSGFSDHLLKLSCRHLCVSDNAKRVRPLLCLYYHWMHDAHIDPVFLNIGVAAEFIHAASLLHDDIIDEADKRRGKSTAHRVFGNAHAVLAGDFLLTEAFDLLRSFDRGVTDRAIDVVREMTKAAILELDARGKVDITVEDWQTIAKGKTGILFSWCGFASSQYLKKHDHEQALWEAFERIGIIFQLADDLKDFHGDNNLKDVCRDIRNLEASLPVILAIKHDTRLRELFHDAFSAGFIEEEQAFVLRDFVIRAGALVEGKALLVKEIARVNKLLAAFQGSKGKDCLDHFIKELTYFALQ